MSTIIAGRFDNTVQVQAVLDELTFAHFRNDEFASYYVNSPGQHALGALDGGIHADAGAEHAGACALSGVTTAGAAGLALGGCATVMAPEAGRAAALAASGVGAHAAFLLGALNRLDQLFQAAAPAAVGEPGGGPMVAICVDRPGTEQLAREALRRHGAHAIERQVGQWENGGWKDFDPRSPV
jgi:hypothetical protein